MKKIVKFIKISVCLIGSVFIFCSAYILYSLTHNDLMTDLKIEKKAELAIKHFVEEYDEDRLTLICSGNFYHLPYDPIFGVWITSHTLQTIDSGRKYAVRFIQKYLSELETNRDTVDYFENHAKRQPEIYSGKISLKNVGVRWAFWDQNVDRPQIPYLAEIDFYQGKFRYYQADPKSQKLRLVLEETYDEAIAKIKASEVQSSKDQT